jgi:hypothetical protein
LRRLAEAPPGLSKSTSTGCRWSLSVVVPAGTAGVGCCGTSTASVESSTEVWSWTWWLLVV